MIHVLDRTLTVFCCFALNFLAMFIRTCQKKNVPPGQPLKSGHGVRNGRTISMTDVQAITRIIDGSADEKRFFVHFVPPVFVLFKWTFKHFLLGFYALTGNNRLTFTLLLCYFGYEHQVFIS